MDKQILTQYIDACALVEETEKELRQLRNRRKTMVQDSVKGSMTDFPYAAQSFHLQGIPYDVVRDPGGLDRLEEILEQRKAAAQAIKVQVEEWMITIPQRMQRIIRYKFFEELSWNEVAARMGRKATAGSVKMEFQRFMVEK